MKFSTALLTYAFFFTLIVVAKPINDSPPSVHPRAECGNGGTIQCCSEPMKGFGLICRPSNDGSCDSEPQIFSEVRYCCEIKYFENGSVNDCNPL
ncbi:hypothetical protein PM082_009726 [Marasmius tenuissimus]|nr:hypothetical protein PM082_009726 [Marasmius tenuissimus]